MGRDKALIQHPNSQNYLSHAAEQLASVCTTVVTSGASRGNCDLPMIEDPVEFEGPIVGVATALRYAAKEEFDACLFIPVDMPNLKASHLSELKAVFQSNSILTIAQSDRLEPLVGIYPTLFASELQKVALSNDRSLYHWLLHQQIQTVTFSQRVCHNVNSPEDLS